MAYMLDNGFLTAEFSDGKSVEFMDISSISYYNAWTRPDGSQATGRGPLWIGHKIDGIYDVYTVYTDYHRSGNMVDYGFYHGKVGEFSRKDKNGNYIEHQTNTTTVQPQVWITASDTFQTNIPIFDLPFGEGSPGWEYGMTGVLPSEPFYCNWTVYSDGESKTILYDSPSFDDEGSDVYGYNSVCEAVFSLYYGDSDVKSWETKLSYNNELSMALTQMYDLTNVPDWQRFLNKLIPFKDLDKIRLDMSLQVPVGNETYYTDTCYVVFNSNGEVLEYGNIENHDKSTVTIENRSPTSEDYENYDDSDKTDNEDIEDPTTPDDSMSVISNGNRVYMITRSQLNSIIYNMWSGNFIDNIKLINNNPIENIISCAIIPFSVATSTNKNVVIGNVDLGISAGVVTNNYVNLGTYTVRCQRKYANSKCGFLDFAPYTTIDLYLPFVGYQSIDTNLVIGKTISINIQADVLSGTVIYIVKCDGNVLLTTTASIASFINITSQNNTEYITRQISNITQELASVSSLNVGGSVNGAIAIATEPHHIKQSGQLSASVAICGYLQPFVKIDRPLYNIPSNFAQTKGFKDVETIKMSKLKGYTVVSDMNLSAVTSATEIEKNMLLEEFKHGVILGKVTEVKADGTIMYV